MSAGLPGTGLGGLFYLLLALAMPVLEVARSLRGDHSPERWRLALTQAGIALGIIGATVGVVVAVRVLVPGARGDLATALLAPAVALGVLSLLTAVIGTWGAVARRRASAPQPA